MHQLCYLVLIAVFSSSAHATDIYRSKDSEGNVVYSDTPGPGAEKVTLGEPTILPSLPPPKSAVQPNDEKRLAVKYESLTITRPTDSQTIRENIANVNVAVSARPGLQSVYGHKLQLLFDGQEVDAPGGKTSFMLPSVDRGAHTLQAVILGSNGKVVMRSPITTFFVHKQSVRRAGP